MKYESTATRFLRAPPSSFPCGFLWGIFWRQAGKTSKTSKTSKTDGKLRKVLGCKTVREGDLTAQVTIDDGLNYCVASNESCCDGFRG